MPKQLLALCFYNLLLVLFTVVDFSKWVIHLVLIGFYNVTNRKPRIESKYEFGWAQKYLLSPFNLPTKPTDKTVLVHCASMGEVVAAMPVIKQLAETEPQSTFVITTNTLTGKQQLLKSIPKELTNRICHNYLPIDLPWLMANLLRTVNPCLVLIMEVELWPNLVRQCHKKSIPLAVINARLTDKTRRGYQKLSWLSQPMIQSLSMVFCRNQTDYNNYLALNYDQSKLTLLGNVKFDIPLPQQNKVQNKLELGLDNRTVLIAGSTHQGEEDALVNTYNKLKPKFTDLLLIIVPRHPHRFEPVFDYLTEQQLNIARMSTNQKPTIKTDVLYCDMMGKLSSLYGAADIAFVGGSLVKKGGHNPIEASAFSIPVLMGQHIYNNPEICQTLADDGGLVICNDQQTLDQTIETWLSSPEQRDEVGQKGVNTILSNQGVIQRLVEKLTLIINK